MYHVTARGNEKASIFVDAVDRQRFLTLVGRVVERFGWRCLSYCLMGNHFHLLVRTPQPNLSRGVQQLKSQYAQSFNRRHDRHGHLFGGRYKSVLVQADAHLLEASRYIALNPVEAGLCRSPAAWPWGAHAALAGRAPVPGFLAVLEARAFFGSSGDYERFVDREEPCAYEPHGSVFGDEEFRRAVLPALRPDAELVERDWGEGRPPVREILDRNDGPEGLVIASRTYGYTLSAIATELGCHLSTVSRRLSRYESAVRKIKI